MIDLKQNARIIISDNTIIYDGLKDCYPDLHLLRLPANNIAELVRCGLIRWLILEDIASSLPVNMLYKIRTIINITDTKVQRDANCSTKEVFLHKPFYLNTLLNIIGGEEKSEQIFCCIAPECVYDERAGLLCYASKAEARVEKLTERENTLLRTLVLSGNTGVSKQELMQNVWYYAEGVDSYTIENHISRLRQKLPAGILDLDKHNYILKREV